MGIDPHVVQVRAVAFGLHARRDGLRLTVHAADRRHDPQFVADTHRAVLAQITHHLAFARGVADFVDLRRVAVLQVVAQIGFQVVRMNPSAGRDSRRRVTDRIAVFHDVLAFGQIAQGEFMAPGDIFAQRHGDTLDVERFTGMQIVRQGDRHVVRSIDFQKAFHVGSEKAYTLVPRSRMATGSSERCRSRPLAAFTVLTLPEIPSSEGTSDATRQATGQSDRRNLQAGI